MKPYTEVLKGLIFSMHSRRFLASLVASAVAWAGWKYGIPYETQAVIAAPIVAFIVGESFADGKARENSGTVNVGNAETVTQGSTPVAEAPRSLELRYPAVEALPPFGATRLSDAQREAFERPEPEWRVPVTKPLTIDDTHPPLLGDELDSTGDGINIDEYIAETVMQQEREVQNAER